MITVTRQTRIYNSRKLSEVDKFAYVLPVGMQRQVAQLLKDGFLDMGGSLYSKIYDLSKTERHIVSIKLEHGDKLDGQARVKNIVYSNTQSAEI